jgi:hypothetical protein
MTVDESKALKKDARVYWRGNAALSAEQIGIEVGTKDR